MWDDEGSEARGGAHLAARADHLAGVARARAVVRGSVRLLGPREERRVAHAEVERPVRCAGPGEISHPLGEFSQPLRVIPSESSVNL